MKSLALPLLLLPLLTLGACASSGPGPESAAAAPSESASASGSATEPASALTPPAPVATADPLVRLRADIDALMARPEHTAPVVRVQHCLIAVEGLIPGVTRSAAEAEALTAELYARLQAGADFDALVKEYTNDEHPGIYAMCLGESPAPEVYPREVMTLAFGDVAWRLAVGEIGVTRYDGERFDIEARSPFGFHLVKRLE